MKISWNPNDFGVSLRILECVGSSRGIYGFISVCLSAMEIKPFISNIVWENMLAHKEDSGIMITSMTVEPVYSFL